MSRRFLTVVTLSAVVLLATAGIAAAALVNSNHDMVAYVPLSGTAASQGSCSFCHVPHKAYGDKLFPQSISTTGLPNGAKDWGTDQVAQICWQCHLSGGNYANANNVLPFQVTAHGRDYSNAAGLSGATYDNDTTEANMETNIYGLDTTNKLISCASCHNPHDNSKRPFIRDNKNAAYTEGDFDTFCKACHVERMKNANELGRTNHPTGTANGTQVVIADVAGASNLLAWGSVSANFRGTWSSLTIDLSDAAGEHYNLGGKLKAGTTTGEFNCGTCHAVHHNETSDFSQQADGDTTVGTAYTLPDGYDRLAVASIKPGVNAVAAICSGCHDISSATAGPGAGGYSHPFQSQQPWDTSIDAAGVATTYGAKFGGTLGTDGTLVCQSCHDMHFARLAADSASADPEVARRAMIRVSCNECHAQSARTGHHPTGTVLIGGSATSTMGSTDTDEAGIVYVATAMNWANATRTNVVTENRTDIRASSSALVYTFGAAGSGQGVMTCGTCHSGSSRAHNNTATFPGFVGNVDEDGMCVDCHGTNPSNNTRKLVSTKADRNGTHYVGPISSPNYKWKYNDAAETVTPKAGNTSFIRYSPDSTNGSLVCTSCHTLKITGVTPQYSNNLSDSEDSTNDNQAWGLLLTPAGNAIIADNNDKAAFLCTACHGYNPGATGAQKTHPVMPAKLDAASQVVQDNANVANNFVTLTTVAGNTNRITCESCHRPHNAATPNQNELKGTMILEDGASGNNYVEETKLCNACHGK